MRASSVPHLLSVACKHVVEGVRPVCLVGRPDGDWCFSCGQLDHIGLEAYCMVGMSHLFDDDPTLDAVLDLPADEEAERVAWGAPWLRSVIPPEDDDD